MKKYTVIAISAVVILATLIITGCLIFNYKTSAPTKESEEVTLEIANGTTYLSLANILKDQNLIKSVAFYKLYIKIFKPNNLQAGEYVLNTNMNLKTLIATFEKGSKDQTVMITFAEGLNMRQVANLIASKTNNTYEEVMTQISDQTYLKTLIAKYWFLSDTILNTNLYYSLEGYLYPDTYELASVDSSVSYILEKLLDQMALELEPYKDTITKSKYSIHELLTLASIVELEGSKASDRATIASVFYNRLNSNMSLGSDATTYYGAKLAFSERDLTQAELSANNGYNTRVSSMAGKLPIGPICNPSLSSIQAVINPTTSSYLYFVSDKNGQIYFTKTNAEHEAMIKKLKSEGLWYNY